MAGIRSPLAKYQLLKKPDSTGVALHAKEDVSTTRLIVLLFLVTEDSTFFVPSTAGVTKIFSGSSGDPKPNGEAQ